MNSLTKRLIAFVLTLAIGFAIAIVWRSPRKPQVTPTVGETSGEKRATTFSNGIVDFKGIKFSYDPSLATEVKAEIMPANVDGKPCDIIPEHPAFTLVGYPSRKGLPDNSPMIRVFPIARFREAMHQASEEMAKNTYPPMEDWGPWLDEEVHTLQALLAKRPSRSNLKSVIVATRGNRDASQLPFLPMWEATQALVGRIRYVDFKNGKGILFLTQWDTETSQITNDGLEYAYQGITDDGLYYVYAEFSATAPVLPKGDEPEVIAWDEKNYLLPHRSKKYQSYLRPVLAKLEALPANKFEPNLESIEKLVQSLEIQAQ